MQYRKYINDKKQGTGQDFWENCVLKAAYFLQNDTINLKILMTLVMAPGLDRAVKFCRCACVVNKWLADPKTI